MTIENSKIQIFTGDGKGKTSAAIGLAVRSAGYGHNVYFLSFDKGGDEKNCYYERRIFKKIENIDFESVGLERFKEGKPFRLENEKQDREEAEKGYKIAKEAIDSGDYDITILDEIITCVKNNLLPEKNVLELISYAREKGTELVLTGRGATEKIIEAGDLVSEIKEIKHYGRARPGIDY